MRPTVGSLFAGIGGMDLGLERAGFEVIWQVEIDDYCRRVLAKHWPEVQRYGDIRELDTATLPVPDIICGGFPCQDISNAGKRAGITGERSGLWAEFSRVVRDLRPRYVLVENVGAFLRRGVDVVLGDLAALGYDAEWECIPAAAVGAPHIRERVFLLAYPQSITQRPGLCADGSSPPERGRPGDSGGTAGAVSESLGNRLEGVFQTRTAPGTTLGDSDWWATESDVCRVVNGLPRRVDRLRGLGNAVVPQVAEYVGRQLLASMAVPNA